MAAAQAHNGGWEERKLGTDLIACRNLIANRAREGLAAQQGRMCPQWVLPHALEANQTRSPALRSPTRARKSLLFLLFLNQGEEFKYPDPIRSDVFLVFRLCFRAREGAHA